MELTVAYVKIAAYIGASLVMAVGVVGPALAQGKVGSIACENIGKYPESASAIRNAMITSLAIIESSAIYLLLIAAVLVGMGYYA